jgi:hypothetical protein
MEEEEQVTVVMPKKMYKKYLSLVEAEEKKQKTSCDPSFKEKKREYNREYQRKYRDKNRDEYNSYHRNYYHGSVKLKTIS